jgi:hypothetical protein
VLERPCPDCGFDAREFDVELIGSMILTNAASWQRVLRSAGVTRRPRPDVWSPLEYACHVRDVFRIYDERLARMLAEDDPQYANWDQDATAVAERYGEQSPPEVAQGLVTGAARLAERFDGVRDDQWLRTGTRSDGARFTVESFARYLIHDPVHHLWDVGRINA